MFGELLSAILFMSGVCVMVTAFAVTNHSLPMEHPSAKSCERWVVLGAILFFLGSFGMMLSSIIADSPPRGIMLLTVITIVVATAQYFWARRQSRLLWGSGSGRPLVITTIASLNR